MTTFIENNNHTKEDERNGAITPEKLRLHFPPLRPEEFNYSGKCSYCDVEINFSDTTKIKIKIENREGSEKLSLYHKGCYERYFRRTID